MTPEKCREKPLPTSGEQGLYVRKCVLELTNNQLK